MYAITLPCGLKLCPFQNGTPRTHERYTIFMVAELGEISRSISCYALKDATLSHGDGSADAAATRRRLRRDGDGSHPGGLGKHAVPPGTSPSAKRPLDRSTFERAQQGVPKQLTMDEMSAGFNNLASLQSRDEQYVVSIARCVEFNAKLLNDLTARVEDMHPLEAKVLEHVEKHEKQQIMSDVIKATVQELSGKVGHALDHVNDQDIARDSALRAELDALTIMIEGKFRDIAASGPAPPPGMPGFAPGLAPGVDKVATMVRQLQNTVDIKMPILEEFSKTAAGRIQDIELKMNFCTQSGQEVQGSMSALRLEVQQIVQEVQQMASAAGGHIIGSVASRRSAQHWRQRSDFDPWAAAALVGQQQQQPAGAAAPAAPSSSNSSADPVLLCRSPGGMG